MTLLLRSLLISATVTTVGLSPQAWAEEDTASSVAQKNARIAGGALFCKLDQEMIEEYITRTEAKISVLSNDTVEKVLTKVEFRNFLDAASAREPEIGCDKQEKQLRTALKDLG